MWLIVRFAPDSRDPDISAKCHQRTYATAARSRQLRLGRRQLFLARIVSRVDVVNTRAGELNLENRLFIAGPCVMRVFCRIHPQCARLQQLAFFLELFTLARSDSAADYRY